MPTDDDDARMTTPEHRGTTPRHRGVERDEAPRFARGPAPPPRLARVAIYYLLGGPLAGDGYTIHAWRRWLVADRGEPSIDSFAAAGIAIDVFEQATEATLAQALDDPAAIVIVFCHAVLGRDGAPATGLLLDAHRKRETGFRAVRALLERARTACFVLASCDSDRGLGRLGRGAPVIATNSGPDLVTHSYHWALAIAAWLRAVRDGASLDQALVPANAAFAAALLADRLIRIR